MQLIFLPSGWTVFLSVAERRKMLFVGVYLCGPHRETASVRYISASSVLWTAAASVPPVYTELNRSTFSL